MRPVADPSLAGGQRLITNSLQGASLSPAPLSTPGSLPTLLTSSGVRPANALSNPSQSKLATANGTSSLKLPSGSQGSAGQSSQENSQDKQAEQAKLVRSKCWESAFTSLIWCGICLVWPKEQNS